MKFIHTADCHIGGWRDPKLNALSTVAFTRMIDFCLQRDIDFLLIAGDLFNTAYPSIEKVKEITEQLKRLKDYNKRVYLIAGSHDYSPTGKTMLDVLEKAGLAINVTKGTVINNKLQLQFTIDQPTGAKITGLLGKRGQLERKYYENLDLENLEQEQGFKIFMFHTTLTELKPQDMDKVDSTEISFLPKGFNYYAGGHVHIVKLNTFPNYKNIVYSGPLFPNSFSELEKLKHGGFYFYDTEEKEEKACEPQYIPQIIKETIVIRKECSHKDPKQIEDELREELKAVDVKDKIITLRIEGKLSSGKRHDVQCKELINELRERGCYAILKSVTGVETDEFSEIKINVDETSDIEEAIINQHLNQIKVESLTLEKEKQLIHELIKALDEIKKEGETKTVFEEKISEKTVPILKEAIK